MEEENCLESCQKRTKVLPRKKKEIWATTKSEDDLDIDKQSVKTTELINQKSGLLQPGRQVRVGDDDGGAGGGLNRAEAEEIKMKEGGLSGSGHAPN